MQVEDAICSTSAWPRYGHWPAAVRLTFRRIRAMLAVMSRSSYFPASARPQEVRTCPSCKREDGIVRNGTRSSGVQRYKCKHCGRNFTDAAANPFGTLRAEPAAILAAAHAILVDKVPVQYVAENYDVSWATADKWAKRVDADPALLEDAKQLVAGIRADVEAVFELVEVAELLGLLHPGEALHLRSTDALDPADRRRRLHELATIMNTARQTRDLVSEIRSALAKEAAGNRPRR